MEKQQKTIFIIYGPTSSGKTSLALNLCAQHNGEIISADSRQTVKYMDLGTGKLPIKSKANIKKDTGFWEINGIKVHGYDLALPNQYFSGYDWAKFAQTKALELQDQGKNVFLVGGTGLYLDMFTGLIKPDCAVPDLSLRKRLEHLSRIELTRLIEKTPTAAMPKDRMNRVRLIRALEKALVSDRNESLKYLTDIKYVYLGLTAPRIELYCRVDSWLDTVWEGGLLDEVKNLEKLGYGKSTKLEGLIYKSARAFLRGEATEPEARQQAKYDLHAYIRRQKTWFKKYSEANLIDITQDSHPETVYNLVKKNL